LDAVVEGIRANGGKAIGVVADVCSSEDMQKVFAETIKEFGDLDILINNAGIGEQKMIDETDDACDEYQSGWADALYTRGIINLYAEK